MKKCSWTASLILFILVSCSSPEPFTINLVVSLTGTPSLIGSEVRNGVSLAVDEINAQGGIKGREILLALYDDENNPQKAIDIDRSLAAKGEVLIIGHITSGITAAAQLAIGDLPIIMVSPTSSTDQLSGKRDNFFRSILSVNLMARDLAKYAQKHSSGDLVVVCDSQNAAFAQGWVEAFSEVFQEFGQKVHPIWVDSRDVDDFDQVANEILSFGPTGVLYVQDALNTARIATALGQRTSEIQQFSSTWALASQSELFAYGEGYLEGLVSVQPVSTHSTDPLYRTFSRTYQDRFKTSPTSGSIYGYEAMLVVAAAMERSETLTVPGLSLALSELEVRGLQGTIELDEFGDTIRSALIVEISENMVRQLESP